MNKDKEANVLKDRVLLLAPPDYDLYKLFEKNLRSLGYDVVVLKSSEITFRYTSFRQKLYNFYRKIKDGNKSYKQILIKKFVGDYLEKQLESEDSFKYSIVIRADFFDLDFLLRVKNKVGLFVSYHYDGLDRDPVIYQYIPIFDRFYVFDENDIFENKGVRTYLSSNFYFDYDKSNRPECIYDTYFLGYYNKSRETLLLKFHDFAKQHFKNVNFQVVHAPAGMLSKELYFSKGIDWLDEVLPFEKYLEKVSKSKIIADFVIDDHEGLSFRIFEGLKYRRKVVTTNKTVKTYDFYHPNNFFVVTDKNVGSKEMIDFFNSTYEIIDSKITEKYSFTKWLERLLNLDSEIGNEGRLK